MKKVQLGKSIQMGDTKLIPVVEVQVIQKGRQFFVSKTPIAVICSTATHTKVLDMHGKEVSFEATLKRYPELGQHLNLGNYEL